ncbi:M16 family metallopeptidase [Mucilaginibacter myungsuensis]|uniref:Insulinase family protein n=1 Tax=Mucilaginibacter myungsuensis TaxID=649104 RepID=A0A929L0N5_9SPHI|nr:M16 family metallopeptidase [Mucilaginibacter myungsuensis]MBE9664082.1 insulinase family protein [Mucilaginibacter myungsuensis]MDN3601261.1 insulinase family protein [Mucilaginibacter myungsuensis]
MKFNRNFSVLALALLLAAGNVIAQTPRRPVPSPSDRGPSMVDQLRGDVLPIDPNVIIGKLPNGLTYYIRKNVQPKDRAELYLVNKAGSILETDAQQGLAHFTEHMAFNGTRDFPKNEMVSYLQKSGVKFGADLNAYTSFDETVYQLPLPTDSVKLFEKGFDILANWAGMVSFDTKEINAERGVILEEQRLRGKNAAERMQQQIFPVLLNNSRYANRLPIGKEQILKTFKPETIKAFYKDWYRPNLQAVIAVGDFDPKRVEQLIKQKFSGLKNPANPKPRATYTLPALPGTSVKIVTDKEFPYTVAEIYVKHPETHLRTETDYLRSMRVGLFNQMLSARLGELMQKPEPPFLFAQAGYGGFLANQDAFTTTVYAKSPEKLQSAIKAALDEVQRAQKFGFTESELDRAKQNAITSMENSWKEKDKTKSANFVGEYQRNFLNEEGIPGIDFEYNFYKTRMDVIKLAEINAMAGKFISDKNRVVILRAPEKEKAKLPTEQTLLSWVNASGKGLTAYVDNVSSKPLLEKEPAGSKIISETKNATIGTTSLTLSNGVKVNLKPTDFKNDEILINAFAFGGTSLASDADYVSANISSGIIGSSGVADMSEIQLGKKLSGKNVGVSPYISETTQGISGSSSPKDLETAFQLIYLYFTQPRKDPDIFASQISQTKALLPNRSLDPNSVYSDTTSAVLGNHHYRRMPLTLEKLATANLDKAYEFYKARFADASGFTFTFVGAFDVEQIKPLLEKYLGGLPSTKSNETFKNLGIHAPAGQLTKSVYKGIGDKSTVQLVFSGDYEFNSANHLQVNALEEILNIKLIERLREKEGGVYSPGVQAGFSKLPESRYSITVYFTCAPANVDKLIAATLDEINKIKQNGAELNDIDKFKAEDKRDVEVQLKENSFWAAHLVRATQHNDDPTKILNYASTLDKVTPQSTKEAANKYLSGNNLIRLILYPEKKK